MHDIVSTSVVYQATPDGQSISATFRLIKDVRPVHIYTGLRLSLSFSIAV